MKILHFFITGMLLTFSLGIANAQLSSVQYTDAAPTIDGEKEAMWDVAEVTVLENFEKNAVDSADLHAQFSTLWTAADTTLHVLIEVTDNSTFLTNAWSSGDYVQVDLDMDNDDATQFLYDDMFWMIRPSWNDSVLVGRYGPNWEGLSQIPWHSTMDDNNYIIEFSIPLNQLGISKFNGNRTTIGFDVKITDGEINGTDTTAKESELVWSTGASWNDPSQMGTLVLSGKPIEPTINTSQFVDDAPVIDGEKDEVWDGADVTVLENLEKGNGGINDIAAQFSTLWTAGDTTLYVLVEVQDDNTYLTDAWSSGDCVQIDIDLDNDDAEQYLFDDMFWMIRPSWNDSTLVGRYGPNWEGLSQIPWSSKMDGSDYVIELALPLADLGIMEFNGNRTTIGFDIKVTDGDIVDADTLAKKNELVWSTGASWNDPSQMGTLFLTGKPVYPIETTSQAIENGPEIDGKRDDAWDEANIVTLENVEKGNPGLDDLSAQFSTLWTADDTTLYVLVEVQDDNTYLTDAWSSGDFVQIDIDLDNDDTEQYLFDDMFWMIRPSWNDSTLVGRYGPNWEGLSQIPWSSKMDGSNYIIELALPLAKLGISSFDGNGTTIGFDLKVTDGDIVGNDTIPKKSELVWGSGESWNNPSMMGTIELQGANTQGTTIMKDYSNNFVIYPIPAADRLNIRTDKSDFKVIIYDINGKILALEEALSNQLILNVSNLNSGLYIICIETGDGNKTFKKIFKK